MNRKILQAPIYKGCIEEKTKKPLQVTVSTSRLIFKKIFPQLDKVEVGDVIEFAFEGKNYEKTHKAV